MLRISVLGVALLGLVVGGIVAGDYKGRIKSVDTEAKKITIDTKDGEKTFKYNADSKVSSPKGEGSFEKLAEAVAKAKEKAKEGGDKGKGRGGMFATVVTDGEGDKETVKEVKMGGPGGGKKKKDSN